MKTNFTSRDIRQEFQNSSVNKTYSVDFNHDADLLCKKWYQNIKPFWGYFKYKNQTIWLTERILGIKLKYQTVSPFRPVHFRKFLKALKAFIKLFQAPQRSVKIKIKLILFSLAGIGAGRVKVVEITESICSVYGCLPTDKKSPS